MRFIGFHLLQFFEENMAVGFEEIVFDRLGVIDNQSLGPKSDHQFLNTIFCFLLIRREFEPIVQEFAVVATK